MSWSAKFRAWSFLPKTGSISIVFLAKVSKIRDSSLRTLNKSINTTILPHSLLIICFCLLRRSRLFSIFKKMLSKKSLTMKSLNVSLILVIGLFLVILGISIRTWSWIKPRKIWSNFNMLLDLDLSSYLKSSKQFSSP